MITEAERSRLRDIISHISRRPTSEGPTPHKDVFLLALLSVFQESETGENRFPLDERLDSAFEHAWKTHVFDLEYSSVRIELPFWYLQNDGVWTVVPKPGCESTVLSFSRATRRRIIDCIEFGKLSDEMYSVFKNQEARSYLQQLVEDRLKSRRGGRTTMPATYLTNPFVAYLNTLQGLDANNQGALAEAQARQPLFNEIRVEHELAPAILHRLLGAGGDPGDVILTGHAGDGKSTLALEVIRSIDADIPFEKRTEVACNGSTIVVVKDLSEWSEPERDALLDEILRGDPSVRHLIVSNTGALLSTFRDRCERAGLDRISVENDLLGAFDTPGEADFGFGTARFKVHNLARRNNVEFGMRMLGRMVESRKWDACRACPSSASCPIFANREILRRNRAIAFERIAWLYERAYAYGGRLTMRQLGAHFAFLLTGGLGCRTAAAGRTEAAFFNLFWGDDGHDEVRGAPRQLRAVALMREQGFNTLRSPSEDRLLRESEETPLARTDPELAALETRLRAPVRARPDETPEEREARAAQSRRNYRRAVYFLGTPGEGEAKKTAFARFLDGFLDSPTLRDALSWRKDRTLFNGTRLAPSLFRVLQEEFSGIRSPEGRADEDRLYITLGGRSPGVRRSAQPVLAECEFSRKFEIAMQPDGTPVLRGRGRELAGAELRLSIPFLDYIDERGRGALGRGLDRAYRNRIEAFKADLLRRLSDPENEELVLLRRNADGSLKTLGIRVRNDRDGTKLEVH